MMHLDDGQLRAWLDQQLDTQALKSANEHLAVCARCASRVNYLRDQTEYARMRLGHLAPDASVRFDAREALVEHASRRKEPIQMRTLIKKPAFLAAGLVALLVIALLFPPVQAMANDFLGLFRVQQVKVISFDPAILGQLDQSMQGQSSQIRQIFQDNIEKVQSGQFTQVDNLQQAASLAGFTPRLPANSQVSSIGVSPEQKFEVTIDTELWNSVLAGLGQDGLSIPADLNGQKITVDVPAGVTTGIGQCESISQMRSDGPLPEQLKDCTLLIELPSPVVTTPDGLDVPRLAEAMLTVLGMDPAQARTFSQSTDWATTLVLPIPSGEGISNRQVNLDGTTATLVTSDKNQEYTLFWVRNGIMYAVFGSGDPQAGLDLSASLPQ